MGQFQEGDDKYAPKYNSQELDKESGYYFYNARYYDPQICRFVTADNVIDGEFDTQGWNRFMYTHGNPIRYKDPTGHGNSIDMDEMEEANSGFTLMNCFGNRKANTDNVARNSVEDKLSKDLSSTRKRGSAIQRDMVKNLSEKPDEHGNYTTIVNGAKVKISSQFYKNRNEIIDSINNTNTTTLGVLGDMVNENSIKGMTVTKFARDNKNMNDPHRFRENPGGGRAIDITEISNGKETVRFRDKNDYPQPKQPNLADKVTGWLREDKRVNQVYTPWKTIDKVTGDGKSNRNQNILDIEKDHKSHMHFGTWPN